MVPPSSGPAQAPGKTTRETTSETTRAATRAATRDATTAGPAPVVVVGGGISGLAAAWELVRAGAPVVLLEASARTGGVMARGALEVPGAGEPLVVDLGPESFLARRPEAVGLVAELGLGDDVVRPEPVPAALATRGGLHPLPAGTVMGAPRSTAGLEGLLTPEEVDRVRAERVESVGADLAVATFVAGRVGRAVVDRLVEPLLGGVYAGSAARLSLRATVPALWDLAQRGEALVRGQGPAGAARAGPAAAPSGSPTTAGAPAAGPVFAGLRGGVARLAEELAARLVREGVDVRTRTPATALLRVDPDLDAGTGAGTGDASGAVDGVARWVVGTPSGEVRARAVVVALPAPAAAHLLRDVAPAAAQHLSRVRTASSAIATLVVPGHVLAGAGRSGLLVPPVDGRLVKAATFSSLKWGWLDRRARTLVPDDAPAVLRVSAGRAGEDAVLDRDDVDLLRAAAAEVGALLGGAEVPVLAGRVDRWRGGLPQYDVGHSDLVAAVRTDVARWPGLALAGSTYDGVGVPACVGLGRAAARAALAGAEDG